MVVSERARHKDNVSSLSIKFKECPFEVYILTQYIITCTGKIPCRMQDSSLCKFKLIQIEI